MHLGRRKEALLLLSRRLLGNMGSGPILLSGKLVKLRNKEASSLPLPTSEAPLSWAAEMALSSCPDLLSFRPSGKGASPWGPLAEVSSLGSQGYLAD